MTNPSEIESHPVETHKVQKQADHPPKSQDNLEAVAQHIGVGISSAGIGAGIASSGVTGIPYIPAHDESHHEHKHHEHKHHDAHHEGIAHDHHGNPQEPLKNKSLGFDAHQLPTM
ncbi:hypothetical protein BGZ96_010196 [Linnemannia gamsii]|uniref:Uncharacterized protein n=1 Tax=Linnemannia gamsii TaxID=64522 RepID=A0ABQ7JUZ6_9FUNG|nr:hypothetical protein BGZ96_010196 [Linnemannia gamsii]